MKQLLPLFLFLLPCLAWAQYPTNGNQKITLGEQTTADGLIYRGVLADTVRKPSIDTMAYMVLDTTTNIIWHYKKATSNAWLRVGGSISSGLTGVLPVANGGTNTSTLTASKVMVGNGTSGVLTPTELHWDNTTKKLGIGVAAEGAADFQISNTTDNILLFVIKNRTTTPSTSTTSRLDFGVNTGLGTDFLSSNTVIGQTNYVGQANDATYAAAKIDVTVTNAGNVGRDAGHSGVMRFHTKPTNNTGVLERVIINEVGNVGIGQTTPTAVLHLKAGTATASTAPLKFTSQGASLLNPVEAGAVEFNGTNLLFTPSTTRHTVNHGLIGSATLNFPSTTTLLSADLTITVTGAALSDVVSLGVPNAAVNANTSYSAWVSAANTVTVRFNNYSSGTVDPASGLFKVFVTK
jgi:hypothetical protein